MCHHIVFQLFNFISIQRKSHLVFPLNRNKLFIFKSIGRKGTSNMTSDNSDRSILFCGFPTLVLFSWKQCLWCQYLWTPLLRNTLICMRYRAISQIQIPLMFIIFGTPDVLVCVVMIVCTKILSFGSREGIHD